ncbi:MAG: hypothetical protein R3B68_01410 [Phycisphaerales bacterium]
MPSTGPALTELDVWLDTRGADAPAELLDRVCREVGLRRTAVESFAPTAHRVPLAIRLLFSAALVAVPAALFAFGVLMRHGLRSLFGAALMIFGAVFTILAVVIAVSEHRMYRAAGLSIRRVCVACGYDVSTIPDAVPPESIRGMHIGPRRCPECAAQWPLVPCVSA